MLDLYQADIADRVSNLKPVQDVEPGAFTNFFRGAGMSAMKAFAEVPRAVSLLNSVYPIIADKVTGGTVLTDRYFKEHDRVFNSAVDYWTPKPNEVGVAGEVTGKLLSMIPMVIAGPLGAVGVTQLSVAEDLARKHADVTATEANLVGVVNGLGLGLGIWMPILGQTLAQRVLVGGAGFNVVQGVATRAASAGILGDKEAAKQFEAFDGTALTLDVLLGLAFGGIAHVVPSQRAQGAAAWNRINDWAKTLKPTEIDALMVLREAQHLNADSLPGRPATEQDISVHVDRMRSAIDSLARDEPVNVEPIKVSRGTSEIPIDFKGQISEIPVIERAIAEIGKPEFESIAAAHIETMGGARLTPEQVTAERDVVAQRIVEDAAAPTREPQFTPDPERLAAAERQIADMQAAAERVRIEEGIPRQEAQVTRPPSDITPLDPQAQARAVGQHIERKLIETGMQRDEAVANAAIWEAFAKSAHERYGIPPSELMAKYGVDVRRMDSADKLLGALEQRYQQAGTRLIDRFTPEEWKAIDAEYLAAKTRRERQRIVNKAAGIKPIPANIERDGAHSPADAESGAPAWDLSGNGVYPEDVYGPNGYRYYATGDERLDRQAYGIVMDLDGKPNASVKIYRAVNATTGAGIIAGDWVTTVRAYAKDHGDSALGGNYKIVSKTVTAKDIYTSGDSWLEWGYNPQPTYPRSIRSNDNGQLLPSERAARASQDGLDNSKVLFQSSTEPFYSELARQVDYLKMNAAPAKGWKDTIKGLAAKGVVKPAEIEATGLNEWLDIQEGKVTKQQVQDFLAQNGVRVEEVVLGQKDPGEVRFDELNERLIGNGEPLTDAERSEYNQLVENLPPNIGTKFSQYQLPGGENYRELLLTLPSRDSTTNDVAKAMFGKGFQDLTAAETDAVIERMRRDAPGAVPDFRSSHFDQPNILAHIRFNERTDADGKRVLFIEEIQSDWAQKGKKEGFDGAKSPLSAAELARLRELDPAGGREPPLNAEERAERAALIERRNSEHRSNLVPSAPFVGKTDAWVALSMKRMIRYAAENGFDRVAWTNGEQQVTRYTRALRKQVDAIEWTKTKDGVQLVGYKGTDAPLSDNGRRRLNALQARAQRGEHINNSEQREMEGLEEIARRRQKVVDTTEKESVLSDAIGKAMADKIKNDPAQSGVIEGADIKIDDTGMATFYDRIVPNVANDVLKKLGGGRVGKAEFGGGVWGGGTSVFQNDGGGWQYRMADGSESRVFRFKEQAEKAASVPEMVQPSFDITPAVRDKAMAGMPLFQGGARGAVNFDTGRTLISLFEKADKSTFQHETAHVFLEMTKDLAARPDSPIAAMQDWATLANWLKIEGGAIPREAHEQFARGWEKYIAEGNAPNEALKGAFKRFRDWLIDIYKSLTNIDSPLNNQVRGVMARMLESQAKDPVSKGGLEDARLENPEFRNALEAMGREAGWDQIGGSILRERAGFEAEGEPAQGAVIGRTEWIPRAEWYARMQASAANMPGVGGKSVRDAVRKALMGEPMSAGEKRAVLFMLDEHVQVMKQWDEVHAEQIHPEADPFEFRNAQHAAGVEPTRENTLDMVLIDRARALDAAAVENIPNNFDDAQYTQALREIIDAKQPNQKTDQGRVDDAQAPRGADQEAGAAAGQAESVAPRTPSDTAGYPPPPGGAGEVSGDAAPHNMMATEAYRIAAENPDLKIVAGNNTDGTPIYKTLNEILDDAAADALLARDDIQLITVAAECLMGVA